MSQPQVDTKTKELLASLASKDEKIVKRAIKSAKVKGNPLIFRGLLKLLSVAESEEIQELVLQYMDDLKSSEAIPILIEAIGKSEFREHRARLIGAFWNSPLNPNEYVSIFVKHAIQDDFLVAMECSTVIDNIEPPYPETEINESLLLLRDYFAEDPDEDKTPLLKDILKVIKEMEHSSQLS